MNTETFLVYECCSCGCPPEIKKTPDEKFYLECTGCDVFSASAMSIVDAVDNWNKQQYYENDTDECLTKV